MLDIFFAAGLGAAYSVFITTFEASTPGMYGLGLVLHAGLWALAVLMARADRGPRPSPVLHAWCGVLSVALFLATIAVVPDNLGAPGTSMKATVLALGVFVMMRSLSSLVLARFWRR